MRKEGYLLEKEKPKWVEGDQIPYQLLQKLYYTKTLGEAKVTKGYPLGGTLQRYLGKGLLSKNLKGRSQKILKIGKQRKKFHEGMNEGGKERPHHQLKDGSRSIDKGRSEKA